MGVSEVFVQSVVVRWFMSTLVGGLLVLALTAAYFWQWLHAEVSIAPSDRVLLVKKGQSLRKVAKQLSAEGIVKWPLVFRLYAQFVQPGSIKAGEYALSPYESPKSLLTRLQGGDVIFYNLTFPEGLTLKQWLAILATEPKLVAKAQAMTPAEIAAYLELDAANPEGWLFPDTYRFELGDSDLDILQRARDRMQNELDNAWAKRHPNLPYASAYEALIMASIIERETGMPHERPDIAGVFVRRLEQKMRLQTDPTVIYGLGDRYEGRIRKKHLEETTPYNTYVIPGLPPTPIANPGREALLAALNPADGKALYFVAKGDGSHVFSDSLAAHNAAVNQYQRRRRADYRASPPPDTVSASSLASAMSQNEASSSAASVGVSVESASSANADTASSPESRQVTP